MWVVGVVLFAWFWFCFFPPLVNANAGRWCDHASQDFEVFNSVSGKWDFFFWSLNLIFKVTQQQGLGFFKLYFDFSSAGSGWATLVLQRNKSEILKPSLVSHVCVLVWAVKGIWARCRNLWCERRECEAWTHPLHIELACLPAPSSSPACGWTPLLHTARVLPSHGGNKQEKTPTILIPFYSSMGTFPLATSCHAIQKHWSSPSPRDEKV